MFSPWKKKSLLQVETFSRESMFSTLEKSLYSEEKTFLRGNMFSTTEKSHVITSLGINAFSWTVFLASSSIPRKAALQQRSLSWQAYKLLCDIFPGKKSFLLGIHTDFSPEKKSFLLRIKTFFRRGKHISTEKSSLLGVKIFSAVESLLTNKIKKKSLQKNKCPLWATVCL